jgi:hypothetical protein
MSRKPICTAYLSPDQQEHVINALYFLRVKFENWKPVARLLGFEEASLADVRAKRRSVSTNLAFRLAKVIGIGIDDLLAGKWPEPGMCPRCGYRDIRDANGKRTHR